MTETINRLPALPDDFAAKLVAGIAESRATTVIAGGGKPLLRMLKSGDWVFGPSNEEVQEGSPWLVNITQLGHGWSCWVTGQGNSKNELRGEIMVPMTEPKPMRPPAINNTDYAEQRSFEAKCMEGSDQGVEILHKTASIGGMRAVDDLLRAIQTRLTEPGGIAHPFPVIVLAHDHYEHTKWGRIYTPVFEVVGWADGDGNLESEPKPAIVQEKSALAPAKPAKPALMAAAKPAEAPAPVSTVQAHVGQRRRPAPR